MKLYLIYGGASIEHDVSITSAFSIAEAIPYEKYTVIPVYLTKDGNFIAGPVLKKAPARRESLIMEIGELPIISDDIDVSSTGKVIQPTDFDRSDSIVFAPIHGTQGEDGTLEGLFETLNIAYVGNDVLASATASDKIVSKIIFEAAGLPQVNYVPVILSAWKKSKSETVDVCLKKLDFPMFVKPSNGGSSLGIVMVEKESEIESAIDEAFKYDDRVIVESGLEHIREFAVGILGNGDFKVSEVGEVIKDREFYDYESKFVDGKIKLDIPASQISSEISNQMKDLAARGFEAIGGKGLARFDFFLSQDNQVFLNELQTMPGFTEFSMYPFLWQASGVPYTELIERLITLGLERFSIKQNIKSNY